MKAKFLPPVFIIFMLGCVGMQISDEPDYSQMAQGFGYTASYVVFANNPDEIPSAEIALKIALTVLEQDEVDVEVLLSQIFEYGGEILEGKGDGYIVIFNGAMMSFWSMFNFEPTESPENNSKAIEITRGFLLGVQKGIEQVKWREEM